MLKKEIMLKSCDGRFLFVNEAAALKSKTIADSIKENGSDKAIHIVKVESKILKYVISYCEMGVVNIEQSILIPFIQAAKHLKIKDLLDLCCQIVSDMIKDKTAEEIRAHFNIKKPLTEEQEEKIRNDFLNSVIFDEALTPKMSERTVVLTSSDGESFVVSRDVALKSKIIANTIEDIGYAAYFDRIPISAVKSNILKLVLDYCRMHMESDDLTNEDTEDIEKWDIEFLLKIEKEDTVFDVFMAADYLNINELCDFCAQAIADRTPSENSCYFNIENYFKEEEEEEIHRENQ